MRYLILYAYRVKSYQVSGPSWIDEQQYEIVAKIPSSGDPKKMPEMLQTLLAERFKLQVHEQAKDVPGFALEVGPDGPKFPTQASEGDARLRASAAGMPSQPLIGNEFLPGGGWRLRGLNASMQYLAGSLATRLECPVIDQTNIKEVHNFVVEGSRADGPDQQATVAGGPDPETSVFYSVRQLGLRLKPMKVPLKIIVVDRAERIPTAN